MAIRNIHCGRIIAEFLRVCENMFAAGFIPVPGA
jgi:hypothetical protein